MDSGYSTSILAETIEVVIDNTPEFTSTNPGTITVKRVWEEKNRIQIKIQPKIKFVNSALKDSL
jgi:hypothetical protein